MTADDVLHTKQPPAWQLLVEFSPSGGPGSEHQVLQHITEAVRDLGLRVAQMEGIRETLLEVLANATTGGNQGQRNLALSIRIWVTAACGQDPSGSGPHATQSGEQEHGGWGFFLVQRQGDDPQAFGVESGHVIDLFLYREGALGKRQTSIKAQLTPDDHMSEQDKSCFCV